MSLSDDVAREFGHVKESQDRIEAHLTDQDTELKTHFRQFNTHIMEDRIMSQQLQLHIAEHDATKKHRWVIVSGIILTAASTMGILAVEVVKHFFMK